MELGLECIEKDAEAGIGKEAKEGIWEEAELTDIEMGIESERIKGESGLVKKMITGIKKQVFCFVASPVIGALPGDFQDVFAESERFNVDRRNFTCYDLIISSTVAIALYNLGKNGMEADNFNLNICGFGACGYALVTKFWNCARGGILAVNKKSSGPLFPEALWQIAKRFDNGGRIINYLRGAIERKAGKTAVRYDVTL